MRQLDDDKVWNWYVNWIVTKHEIDMQIGWWWNINLIFNLDGYANDM